MTLDYATLDLLRQSHPAWRLLRSEHAPLVASFLQRVFIAPNVRVMAQADLAEALEDELYALRERLGAEAFPKAALDYLNDWAANDKGWLRKYYAQGSDEPHFDLMPATEKAIAWLATLAERSFVGTESRLLTLFELLKQMSEGSETDPQARIAELQRRRDEIDAEIARVLSGDLPMLDDTGLKDRFQQFTTLARELLTDFREVEHNFRGLDRRVRERIALWEGAKGALLEEIMGERDAIADSDQGRSFRAFWDFLMSSRRQEELTALLERVLALPPVLELRPRRAHPPGTLRLAGSRRAHAAHGRPALAAAAPLSRRPGLAGESPHHGHPARHRSQGAGAARHAADGCGDEHRRHRRRHRTADRAAAVHAGDQAVDRRCGARAGDEEVDAAVLFSQVVVDRAQLARHIRHALQDRSQVTLRELCETRPLEHGLAELVAYLQLADDTFKAVIDEDVTEVIVWQGIGRTVSNI
jgi:flagellar motility protein MotE (MotC chaperone)